MGAPGGSVTDSVSGGGGGGAGGGTGGTGGDDGGDGGTGGNSGSPNGQEGRASTGDGGGGGGGGFNGTGSAGAAAITNSSALSGGTGGSGGGGASGGGGGAGGFGAVVTGSGASSNSGSIGGGRGGGGGTGDDINLFGGNGGDGGVGVQFTESGARFTNSGTVAGGDGGAGGSAMRGGTGGTGGLGGAGIVGAGLTVINSGAITGGLGGDGVTRANAITFTGGSNTLTLQNGSSLTGNIEIDNANAGSLTFNQATAQTLGNAITGNGSVVQNGAGTLTLTGANTFTGATTVNGGTLEVDGSIAASSSVTVNAGGTLSGTGIVDPAVTTIMSGATLAPGSTANPTGTLTISGNLAFQSGALYVVQVNSSGAASTTVSGTATLSGASVQTVFAPGSSITKSYDILHATGGLGGTMFSGVSGNLPAGFSENLSYSGTDVFLNLTGGLGAAGGLNRNQQNVANTLNAFFNNGGALPPGFANLFGLSGGTLGNALSQVSGEAATGAEKAAFQMTTQFLELLLDPWASDRGGGAGASGFAPEQQAGLPPDVALAYASVLKAPPANFDARWNVWGSAFGGSSNTNGNPVTGSNNLTAGDYGFAAGADYRATPNTILGFALAGGGTNWNLAQGLGGGHSDAFQAGLYSKTTFGSAYVSAALSFANHWFTTNRTALGDQLTATFEGQDYAGRIEGGYRFALPVSHASLGITPYAALQTQLLHTPGYSETDLSGGGFGLDYGAMSATDTRSEIGARFDNLQLIDGMPLILRARVAWAHDWVSDPALQAAFQALPGSSFIVNGAALPTDSALITASAELHLNATWSLLARFDGEFASNSQTYAGTGTLRASW
jgi:uncharacterized protein with beta-barrel porin domain